MFNYSLIMDEHSLIMETLAAVAQHPRSTEVLSGVPPETWRKL
jgi:hypothetical protein